MTLNLGAMARSRGWTRDEHKPVWRDSSGAECLARGPLGWGVDGTVFDTEDGALAAAVGLSPAHARAIELGWTRSDQGWVDGPTIVVWTTAGEFWWARNLEDDVQCLGSETEALLFALGMAQPTVGDLLAENEKLRGILESLMGGE